MKRWCKTAILLLAIIPTLALALPSTAPAASWALFSTHILGTLADGIKFNIPTATIGVTCRAEIPSQIQSSAVLVAVDAAFSNCFGTGQADECVVTTTATQLGWNITGVTTSNVVIDGFSLNLTFLDQPATPPYCRFNGAATTVTGALTGGVWVALGHWFEYTTAEGLTAHGGGLANTPVTVSGTLRDSSFTLNLS